VTPERLGTLYGLGLGPGDPELITLKALRLLRSVPTLLLPVRRPGDTSYAWSIAAPHLVPGAQRLVELPFPQGRGERALDAQWDRHAETVLAELADGRDAAFPTEGDPLFYGSFIQLAGRLRALAPTVQIEIVPGVTSPNAAAAAAGEPLVARGERLAVLPAEYGTDELRRTLADFDTVVLLKVNQVLDRVAALLEELGLAERALLVERCGRPEQRIIRGLWPPPTDVDYFALVIVKR
jgi:precorrin-2/cobalt-factor-2 C20-methyltransferase